MLDIRLLGAPLVYLDGELLIINRRATRALFFYLIINKEPIDRAKLCDFLWGDKGGEKEQRQKLRVTLNNLRKSFPNREVIRTYHDMVGLVQHDLRVDVWEFDAAIEKMRHYISILSEGPTLPPGLYQDLVKAAKLWRSATFVLNGDMQVSAVSENWWLEKNRGFDKDKLILFKFVSRQEGLMGRRNDAISWAKKAIEIDDYDEEAHFLLLRNLLNANQRKEGREHYRSIKGDFSEEWGGDYVKRIHDLGQKFAKEEQVSLKNARPKLNIRKSAHLPFVGQEDALKKIHENYQRGKVSLILGEAGAGKTRLVQEFCESLGIMPELLLAPCLMADKNIPYQPLTRMLRNSVEKSTWQIVPATWIEPITMLLPELRDFRDDIGGEVGDTYAKPILFEAIKNLLILVAEDYPYLLFLDDVQWADDATVELLIYLLQESSFSQKNMRLIIASRIEEQSVEFNHFLLTSPKSSIREIKLRRLSEKNISDLAFYLLQEELSPKAAEKLSRETGGNPFFILEILMAIWALPNWGNLEKELPVPASVRSLIERRLENLSVQAKELLYIAAILGNPFEFRLLEKTAELSLKEMLFVIEELEDAQLIREEKKKGVLQYAFVHEKIRKAIIDSLSLVQSRFLHKKVAQALEEMSEEYKDSQAAILAEHYEKSEAFTRAFGLWVQAGQYAYHLFSVKDATTAYKRAESLIAPEILSESNIYNLYSNWGVMLYENDNPDELEKVMQRFLAISESRGSALLLGAALNGMSDLSMARNQFKEGLAYTKEAISYLRTSNHTPALMNALIHRGVFLYMLNKFTISQEFFKEALVLGEGRDDPASLYILGNANFQMAIALTGMGFPKKALSYAQKSLHAMRLSRSSYGAILPYNILGLAHYYLANYEKGRDSALKSISIATRTDSWRMMGYSFAYAGMNETELASLGTAWQYGQKAIELGKNQKHTEIVSLGYKIFGDIYTHLDAFPQARDAYQKGVDVDPGSFAMLENLARLGVTLSLLGDPKGDAILQQALSTTKATGLESIFWNAKSLELGTFLLHNDCATFEENYPLVEKNLKERTHPDATGWIEHLQAFFSLYQGKPQKAQIQIETLLLKLENSPFFWTKFRTLKLYVQILQALGQETTAPRAEIEEMLQKIESGLRDAPIQEEWQSFAENTRSLNPKPPV